MPEELLDIVEDLFDEAKKRRKKSKKRKKQKDRHRSEQQPDQVARTEQRQVVQQQSGDSLIGRITSFFQPAPPPPKVEPDPIAELDRAHQQQVRLLDDVRRSVESVAEATGRMRDHARRNAARIEECETDARDHLAAGREDLARVALERKRLATAQSSEIERELAKLSAEQTQLLRAEARLETKIDAFRMRRDVLQSQRASAEAQVRISEMYGGISEESSDVAYTLKRIEAHTSELRSQGAAVDQMLDDGLVDGVEDPRARFDRRLEMSGVEEDLARLRRDLDRSGR